MTSFRHSLRSEPTGARALVLRPNWRVVDSGNEGCPGGTLVPAVDVRHFQFCTKRYRYHARRVQSRRVLGLPPFGEVVPCSPWAAGSPR